MYLMEQSANYESMVAKPPLGPGFEPDLLALAGRMEIWASDFGEPEDYTLFILFDKEEKELTRRKIPGY